MLFYFVDILFTVYTFLLMVRVIGSWFASIQTSWWMRMVGWYTDPYLDLFRKIIPPLGMLDLSPLVAFFALQIIRWVIMMLLRQL